MFPNLVVSIDLHDIRIKPIMCLCHRRRSVDELQYRYGLLSRPKLYAERRELMDHDKHFKWIIKLD